MTKTRVAHAGIAPLALTAVILLAIVVILAAQGGAGQAEPELFAPGVVSTPDDEAAVTISPDSQSVFFGRGGAILESRWLQGKWSTAEVASFSGRFGDYYPALSRDGSKLYFTSNRPVPARPGTPENFDIWVTTKTADAWSEPENLGSPINSDEGEVYCSTTRDGTIFFGSGRKGTRHILVSRLAEGKYTEPESLSPGINTRYFQGYHAVPSDGRFIVFTSNRPGGFGGLDLYISYRTDSGWTEPDNLGPWINTAADESHASISPDDQYLFFTSNRTCLDNPPEQRLTYKELLGKLRGTLGGSRNIYRVPLLKERR